MENGSTTNIPGLADGIIAWAEGLGFRLRSMIDHTGGTEQRYRCSRESLIHFCLESKPAFRGWDLTVPEPW